MSRNCANGSWTEPSGDLQSRSAHKPTHPHTRTQIRNRKHTQIWHKRHQRCYIFIKAALHTRLIRVSVSLALSPQTLLPKFGEPHCDRQKAVIESKGECVLRSWGVFWDDTLFSRSFERERIKVIYKKCWNKWSSWAKKWSSKKRKSKNFTTCDRNQLSIWWTV